MDVAPRRLSADFVGLGGNLCCRFQLPPNNEKMAAPLTGYERPLFLSWSGREDERRSATFVGRLRRPRWEPLLSVPVTSQQRKKAAPLTGYERPLFLSWSGREDGRRSATFVGRLRRPRCEPLLSVPVTSQQRKKAAPLTGYERPLFLSWSGREDLNLRPPQPHCGALPGCATPRPCSVTYRRPAMIRADDKLEKQ